MAGLFLGMCLCALAILIWEFFHFGWIFRGKCPPNHFFDINIYVPADKASNNVVFICKTYYYSCLQKELIDNNDVDSSTYQRTNFTKEEILVNHRSVLTSFGVSTQDENVDLPSVYWIPKLHKDPYKQRFIAGSAKLSTKPLSRLLTSILTTVKVGLKKYCDVIYSRSGINQMWILKNSK